MKILKIIIGTLAILIILRSIPGLLAGPPAQLNPEMAIGWWSGAITVDVLAALVAFGCFRRRKKQPLPVVIKPFTTPAADAQRSMSKPK